MRKRHKTYRVHKYRVPFWRQYLGSIIIGVLLLSSLIIFYVASFQSTENRGRATGGLYDAPDTLINRCRYGDDDACNDLCGTPNYPDIQTTCVPPGVGCNMQFANEAENFETCNQWHWTNCIGGGTNGVGCGIGDGSGTNPPGEENPPPDGEPIYTSTSTPPPIGGPINTPTFTPTKTPTATMTPTFTPTKTPTKTPTPTVKLTYTPTKTPTPTSQSTCKVGGKKFEDRNFDRMFNSGDNYSRVTNWTFYLYSLNSNGSRTQLASTVTSNGTWSNWPNSFQFTNLDCSKKYIIKEELKPDWYASGDYREGVRDSFTTWANPTIARTEGSEVWFYFDSNRRIVIDTQDQYNGRAVSGFHFGNTKTTASTTPTPILSCQKVEAFIGSKNVTADLSSIKYGDTVKFIGYAGTSSKPIKTITFRLSINGVKKEEIAKPATLSNGSWVAEYNYTFITEGEHRVEIVAISTQ